MQQPNLYDLRSAVTPDIAKDAGRFARANADDWPYGIYHPNDLTSMFEMGYLAGFLAAYKEQCQACRELKVIGTDGCSHCEDGRVTMYTQGDSCLECKRRQSVKP